MNAIEEKFYKCFDIKQLDKYLNCKENLEGECQENCEVCDKSEDVYCYPPITDRVLLELLCILSGCCNCTLEIKTKNVEDLKNGVLQQAIDRACYALDKDKYKHQVRKLFL